VNKAYQSAGQDKPMLHASNAIGAYANYLNAGQIHADGSNPPRGALVFYSWENDGHVGISLGDGSYMGTLTQGPNTGVRPIQSPTYLGWAYP
jgi:cell wall-associated NlpC family hydrolase